MSPGSGFAMSGSVLSGATARPEKARPENQPCLTAPIPLVGSTG
ncbi:hypothetical protein SAMN04487819_1188 [Actinopolyspora alba]|uniref:Uncharacterized protein n=1 Tax=Actinopolyspora alba TaxID=673379 RepID=A0A1I2BX33_9ACTN|nr:hypothetical protein SAMN04487819_1188 [Actinopolyspora alba]